MKLFKKKRTNRIFSLIIAIVMVISAVNMTVVPAAADEDAVEVSGAEVPTAYSQGEAVAYDADITISNAEQLKAFRDAVNDGYNYSGLTVALTGNIDLGGEEWKPIGTSEDTAFAGTFDGGGYEISGLYISMNPYGDDSLGLFGYTGSTAEIKELTVSGSVSGTYVDIIFAGGIAGWNDGTITDCSNKVNIEVSVSGDGSYVYSGGIAAVNNGVITGCDNAGTIDASINGYGFYGYNGGIAGNNGTTGTLTNCSNTGQIEGDVSGSSASLVSFFYYGGYITGYNSGEISGCNNTADFRDTIAIGNGIPFDSYGFYMSGISGYNIGNIIDCCNTGDMENSLGRVSGITSENTAPGTISNCYNTGDLYLANDNGEYYAFFLGGIVARNSGRITDCYNTGNTGVVEASDSPGTVYVGGIAGYSLNATSNPGEGEGVIENCYNAGSLSGNDTRSYIGGIVGRFRSDRDRISNCYYLDESSRGIGDAGYNGSTDDESGMLEKMSSDDFASGEVTYLLNGDQSNIVWYQTIGTDPLPTLDSISQIVISVDGSYDNLITSISTVDDLKDFRDNVNNGIDYSGVPVELLNDIDLGDEEWEPIGWEDASLNFIAFRGIFDGKGHSITGLNVTSSRDKHYGLFGIVGGDITNLEVEGKIYIDITSGSECYTGGIAGQMRNSASITNCSFKGSISTGGNFSELRLGGIVGYLNRRCTVNNCWSNAEVTDKNSAQVDKRIGGVIGSQEFNSTITNSYCFGTLGTGNGTEPENITAVAGVPNGTIENSAIVTADDFASGKVAYDLNYNDGVEETVWYQNIDIIPEGGTVDSYPTLKADHNTVYNLASVYTNGRGILTVNAANSQSTKDYNAGDEFEVSINAIAEPGDYTSVQFTLDYDHDKLEIAENGVTTSITGGSTAFNNDIFAWSINGADSLAIGETATEVAKVKFKVKTDTTEGETSIGLKGCELMPTGEDAFTPISSGDTVTLHNIIITLNGGNGTITFNNTAQDNGLTLYGKYNETGLYSDPARSTAVSADAIVLSASTGYRLANGTTEPLWSDGAAENPLTFADNAALLAGTFTESKTLTLQTVRQYTVTIDPAVNGSYSGTVTPIVVDAGTAYSSLALPDFTPNENYTPAGWYIKGETDTPVDMVNGTVTGDVTIYAKAVESQYDFATDAENCGISVTSGVTADNKVQYNTDVVFDITNVGSGYAITGVYYSVNNGTPVAATHVSGTTYRIPGEYITGNITITATASPYYTLTFNAGNSTFAQGDNTTAYVIGGVGGMYTAFDTATMMLTGTFTLPTPTANEGYRLLNGTGEFLWADGNGNRYTNATLAQTTFTGNATVTVQTIARYDVIFEAGANGSLEGTASITVDAGHTLRASDVPTPVPDKGYVFTDWSGSETIVGDEITGDVTYTADFTHGIYNVTNGSTDIANITFESGIEYDQATHGTDVTFTVSKADADDNYEIIAVMYSIANDNEHQSVTLTPDSEGVYTIPGSVITGDVTITATSRNTVTLSFVSDDTTRGTVTGTTVFTILTGNALGETNFALVITNALKGYTFSHWELAGNEVSENDIVNMVVDETLSGAAVEYRAVFDHGTYSVSSEDVNLEDTEGNAITQAVHGTDLTFTPVKENRLVANVSVTIDGEEYSALVNNGDGSYTIAGNDITGNIVVTAFTLRSTVPGDPIIEFISEEDYKALAENTKIAVLNINMGDLRGNKPMYDNREFYRSDKYNAYFMIVDADVTAEDIANGLYLASGNAQVIDYGGDLNGSGSITAADAGIINELIYKLRTAPTDMQRLMADVWHNTIDRESLKSVTVSDVLWALRKAVGLE